MSRPMASHVSTLSGCVANRHQAIHLVSSAPSKIPYGGFSPVRLQTSLTPQPPSRALMHPLIDCHCSCPRPQRFTRKRTRVQTALRSSTRTTGPVALGSPTGSVVRPAHRLLWPHLRLCRPPVRLMNYSVRLRSLPRQPERVPNLLRQSFDPMPLPLLRWSQRLLLTMPSSLVVPSPLRYWLGNHKAHQSGTGGSFNEAAAFTLWCGLESCLPCSGQDFYYRACLGRVTHRPKSVMTRWFIVIYHRRILTGWTGSLVGLRNGGNGERNLLFKSRKFDERANATTRHTKRRKDSVFVAFVPPCG